MARNWFKNGEWNVWCMVCNRKIKSGIALKRWDGLIVCPEDYENRHPQDFIRTRQERITVPFAAPTSFNLFDGPDYPQYPYCTATGSSGIPTYAIAGCMRPNLGFPNGLPTTPVEIPDEPNYIALSLLSGGNWLTVSGNTLVTVTLDD